jgi:hypothetical protein
VLFGILSVLVCFRVVKKIANEPMVEPDKVPDPPPATQSPFSTGKAATLQ